MGFEIDSVLCSATVCHLALSSHYVRLVSSSDGHNNHLIDDMSYSAYIDEDDEPKSGQANCVALGEIKTPPFSADARVEAGVLLRRLQRGEVLAAPHSRPIPVIGARCHELRIREKNKIWRVVYRTDQDAVIILTVFQKTTRATPLREIENSKRRLSLYDIAIRND